MKLVKDEDTSFLEFIAEIESEIAKWPKKRRDVVYFLFDSQDKALIGGEDEA